MTAKGYQVLSKLLQAFRSRLAATEGCLGSASILRACGRTLVHNWTSPQHVDHYPIRAGYASTLHKVQGATLPHITLWLDIPNMPAAAYVALSRVEYDANWRFVGDPGVHHFTPARF